MRFSKTLSTYMKKVVTALTTTMALIVKSKFPNRQNGQPKKSKSEDYPCCILWEIDGSSSLRIGVLLQKIYYCHLNEQDVKLWI